MSSDDHASGATSPALAWYKFTHDRSDIHPQTELKAFMGLLQAADQAGLDKLYQGNRIKEVAYWAGSPLFRIEDEIRSQPPDIRRHHREEQSRPPTDALRSVIKRWQIQ